MSTSYAESGRSRQKLRTRGELVAAARSLIADGGSPPTVAEAASAASISRTTAYRYFGSQRELLAAAHPEIERASLLPDGIGQDPEERLVAAVETFVQMVIDTEAQQRTMLRLSLEASTQPHQLPLRQGRAIAWFEEALSPLLPEIGQDSVTRLAVAVRSAVGIESLVWLLDVAGLSRADAALLLTSNARALLRDARRGRMGP
jgi:AcrR family transcriptional regulator